MQSILSNKRIAIVAGTLGQGGAERQLMHLLGAYRALGAVPTVLSLTKGEYYEQRVTESGGSVVHVGRSAWRLKRASDIIRACRAINADAVASMHFFTNLYAVAAARRLRIPEIGAMRSDCFREIRSAGRLGRASARMPRIIAANSRQAIENAVSLGLTREKFFYLPNVVDNEVFRPGGGRETGTLTLLFAGRLDESKRADRFLRLLLHLRERFDVRGIIVGEGPLRSKLEKQAAGMGLFEKNGVVFSGMVADTLPYYRRADVFVSCSDAEGTPNVILEAQACGLPVVAMAAGGVADLIEHNATGILVRAGDDDGLLFEAQRLAESPSLRELLGAGARAFIESNHSPHSLLRRLEELYRIVFGKAEH